MYFGFCEISSLLSFTVLPPLCGFMGSIVSFACLWAWYEWPDFHVISCPLFLGVYEIHEIEPWFAWGSDVFGLIAVSGTWLYHGVSLLLGTVVSALGLSRFLRKRSCRHTLCTHVQGALGYVPGSGIAESERDTFPGWYTFTSFFSWVY